MTQKDHQDSPISCPDTHCVYTLEAQLDSSTLLNLAEASIPAFFVYCAANVSFNVAKWVYENGDGRKGDPHLQ
jgi:hypothetical protein